jgi:hypothetical protein
MDLGASTICIERLGPMDRYISPLIISNSDAGVVRGRAYILKPNNPDVTIGSQIVDGATMKQLAGLVLATRGDGPNQASSWGAVKFTVLLPDSTRDRVLVRAHAAALLKSLLSSTKDDGLQSALKGFLDYEMPAETN